MSNVVSLSAYRSGLRISGTTLCWRDLRHTLEGTRMFSFCKALVECNHNGGTHASPCGFLFVARRKDILISGWDLGPMIVLRGKGAEADRIAEKLLAAEIARIKAGKPVVA